MNSLISRRTFLNGSLTAGLSLPGLLSPTAHGFAPEDNLLVIGPLKGYSPQIGTLVSMLNYNRDTIIRSVKGMTKAQLDFLFDAHANTIGSLLLHLGQRISSTRSIHSKDGRNSTRRKKRNGGPRWRWAMPGGKRSKATR